MDLNLFQFGPIPPNVIVGSYNYGLVALSYMIAVFASYVALDFAGRLRAETLQRAKLFWLLGGAMAMGAGIWSMHFVGMLAFIMPMSMRYDPFWTILSLIVAIIAAGIALFIIQKTKLSQRDRIAGGILLGLGIVTMHYMGMQGMTIHTNIRYTPGLFLLSIIVAIVASVVALWLVLKSNQGPFRVQLRLKVLSALIMGAAICGMHYIGMEAAVFTPLTHASILSQPAIAPYTLAFYIAGATGLIILIALIVSTYKQFVIIAIQDERDFLNALLDNLSDGVLACNSKGKVTVFNRALQKILKLPIDNKLPKEWTRYFSLFFPDSDQSIGENEAPLVRALHGERISALDLDLELKGNKNRRNIVVDGQPIINAHGRKMGAVIAIQDTTERKNMERKILHQATHDALTNLPNRKDFQENLSRDLEWAIRQKYCLAVIFIDINNFKNINVSLGYQGGDALLVNVANRLRSFLRKSDFIARFSGEADFLARLGGDEFVFIVKDLKNPLDVGACVRRIYQEFQKPFVFRDKALYVELSIGIAVYPTDSSDVATLMQYADIAMCRAKELGKNNFQFYTEEMGKAYNLYLTLENSLYEAVANNDFHLTYEPQYELSKRKLRGLEVLLRWTHPTLGVIPPSQFIPIAEKTGLILSIGEWVLKKSCEQYMQWQAADILSRDLQMTINLSPYQLIKGKFAVSLRKVIEATGISPRSLEFEITETSLMTRLDGSEEVLDELKEIGVSLSIDDFGTGYSSLSRIKQLPISVLKIDKSFIKNVSTNEDDSAIVKAIIALAYAMGLTVIAEGVEEEDQVKFLIANKCQIAQGFYFSKALVADEMEKLFKRSSLK